MNEEIEPHFRQILALRDGNKYNLSAIYIVPQLAVAGWTVVGQFPEEDLQRIEKERR